VAAAAAVVAAVVAAVAAAVVVANAANAGKHALMVAGLGRVFAEPPRSPICVRARGMRVATLRLL
jgi:hypothetical protein